ncbi:outer membrane protein [Pseudaminobacter soli (ex Li et al. 2025)]|uniref:Porin family protein n=1 Tax=Pseudaminobacter soli (ex Li et al. 2025) TaxID=1295366 RepID=A0A2P7RJD7_9HYPH|nr:outer membrane protein [Mesorhizobium soli]PSJ50340.1 porin family protein [Mesorhizobium soli]
MRNFIIASALLAASTTGAKAADVVVQEPVAAYNWSGVYVGGQVGYVAGGKVNHDYVVSDMYDYRLSPRGAFGGIFGGYNYQLDGGVVVGIEGDVNWGDVKATGETVGDPDFASTTKLAWNGSGRVRLGYAFDRVMPYVTGGFAVARLRFEERENGSFYDEAAKNLTGWTLGAGAEYAVTDNWTLRGEYRYTQYGKKDFVAMPQDEKWETKIRTHDLRLGVAYKF